MFEQKKILIVEDDPKTARQLASYIKKLGFSTAGIARSGTAAVLMAGELEPDLVLADIELKSDFTAIEAASVIRDKMFIPVIFISGKTVDTDVQVVLDSEPHGYIVKPVTTASLNTSIITSLYRNMTERRISNKGDHSQAILNSLDVNICVLDETGVIILTNNQWKKFAVDNFTPDRRIGMGMNYLGICESTEGENSMDDLEFAAGIREVMQGKRELFSQEYTFHLPHEDQWFNRKVTPFPGRLRGAIGAVISYENITGRKLSEEALRISEARWKLSVDGSGLGLWDWNVQTGKVFYSKQWKSMLGFDEDEISDSLDEWDKRVNPEDKNEVYRNFDNHYEGRNPMYMKEYRILCKDGTYKWILDRGKVISWTEDKKPLRFIGTHTDITERKIMEEALRKSERDFSTLVENASDIILRYDRNFRYIYCNVAVERVLGVAVSRLMGKTPLETGRPKEHGELLINSLKRVMETGEELEFEQSFSSSFGEKWLQTRMVPERNENGEIESLMGISRDITGYKKATGELEQYRNHLEELVQRRTEELLESEKRYREIIDSITDYVYQVKIGRDKQITTIHAEGCFSVTGYHSHELMSDPFMWLKIVFEEDRERLKNFIKSIYADPEYSEKDIEHRITHKSGVIRWIKNTLVVHRDQDGELTGYDGAISDITEIKKAEDEIRRLNLNIMNLQEQERQRVAKDLHDSVGQTILAAKINLDAYKQNPVRFSNRLDVGLDFLIRASQELREIYMDLYPTILTDLGLEMTIRWLVENTMETAGIKSNLDINLNDKLPHDVEVNLYRIIQELLSNILKHSHADTFDLLLNSQDRVLKLIVKDNGTGIEMEDKNKISSGCGMTNIKSRISHLNGKISLGRNDPVGTIIIITIGL